MKQFLKLTILVGLSLSAVSAFCSELLPYNTPCKGIRSPESVTATFFSPNTRSAIKRMADQIEPTPEGQSSRAYRRTRIDKASSPRGKAAERLARKKPANKNLWFDRLERLETNRSRGKVGERQSLESFQVAANSQASYQEITPAKHRKSRKKQVCCIPDGYAVDRDGKPIVFEVKVKSPKAVLYATEQLRAEEKRARELRGRHIISIRSETDDITQFPVPSASFKKKWFLRTEFRFTDKSEQTYRWYWTFGADTGYGYWEEVEEVSDLSCSTSTESCSSLSSEEA